MIELNPYEPQTGGGLFNWKDPDDLALLERGPLTLRLATQPRPRLQATLEVFISELPVLQVSCSRPLCICIARPG